MIRTSLEGQTVVITGASRGIGKAAAELFRDHGATVFAGSRTQKGLESMEYHPLDVMVESSVAEFYEAAQKRLLKIDMLINCAGIGVYGSVLDSSTDDFDRMVMTNLRGTYLLCKYFGRHMEKQGYGKIINVISIAGKEAIPGWGGYVASKFGLLGLTRVLQAELRHKGIQVTAVLPGAVDTPFWDSFAVKPNPKDMLSPKAVAEYLLFLACQPEGAVVDEMTIMPPRGILPVGKNENP